MIGREAGKIAAFAVEQRDPDVRRVCLAEAEVGFHGTAGLVGVGAEDRADLGAVSGGRGDASAGQFVVTHPEESQSQPVISFAAGFRWFRKTLSQ